MNTSLELLSPMNDSALVSRVGCGGRAGVLGPLVAVAALLVLPWCGGAAEAESGSGPGLTLFRAPEGAKVFSMSLTVVDIAGGRPRYLTQRSTQPLEELTTVPPGIAQTFAGKEFTAYQFAMLPDGTCYVVALNEDNSAKFLNRSEAPMWYARIYRVPSGGDGKPTLVREGYQTSGGDVTVPVQLETPGIGATKVKSMRTDIGYSLSGVQNGEPQVYSGRTASLQVSGSQLTQDGKLTLTVTVPDSMKVTPETQVSLRFEPAAPGLPEHSASGRVSDFLTLGSTRLAVTALAPDFSSASVAVVAGSLEETVKEQLQLGAQMPAFSQVELVERRTVTREDVLTKSRTASGVVFVFGDLPTSGRTPYEPMYRPGQNSILALGPGEVAEQLGTQLQPKPLVVFVTRQIGLNFLYEDLRNKTPDYLVLSDFVDPLRTTFRVPQMGPGGWYGPPMMGGQEPSLRQLFNLPGNTVSLAAFDSQGKVLYVKANASSGFLPALAEARAALEKQKSGK